MQGIKTGTKNAPHGSEKWLERGLRKGVESKGGKCLKMLSSQTRGLPDRLVLMPGGRCRFVECKSVGRKPRLSQRIRFGELARLGFPVSVIDSEKALNEFLCSL